MWHHWPVAFAAVPPAIAAMVCAFLPTSRSTTGCGPNGLALRCPTSPWPCVKVPDKPSTCEKIGRDHTADTPKARPLGCGPHWSWPSSSSNSGLCRGPQCSTVRTGPDRNHLVERRHGPDHCGVESHDRPLIGRQRRGRGVLWDRPDVRAGHRDRHARHRCLADTQDVVRRPAGAARRAPLALASNQESRTASSGGLWTTSRIAPVRGHRTGGRDTFIFLG
jgi:hypothetical protein